MKCLSNAKATLSSPVRQPSPSTQNAVEDDLGSDEKSNIQNGNTLLSILCNIIGPGVYLGYPTTEKYRCWVADLSQTELDAADRSSADLGKKLLQLTRVV